MTGQTVKATSVLASLKGALWHPHGITLDWSLVSARFGRGRPRRLSPTRDQEPATGRFLTQVTGGEISTITMTATGGTPHDQREWCGHDSPRLQLQCRCHSGRPVALSTVGAGNATVTGTGPYVITFAASLGDVICHTRRRKPTGGTANIAETARAAHEEVGPYDPAATDGRQTLTRGNAVIVGEDGVEKDNPA